MLFHIQSVRTLLALASVVLGSSLDRRDNVETPLYAYGTNISGVAVFYGDGLAYIGDTMPDWLTAPSAINFSSSDSTSTTVPWTVSFKDSTVTGSPALYIVPTSGSFTQVGFQSSSSSNSTIPSGAVTTGFALFGRALAYQSTDGPFELQFWARATNTTGIWELFWNAGGEGGESVDGLAITPVTLKTVAPIIATEL